MLTCSEIAKQSDCLKHQDHCRSEHTLHTNIYLNVNITELYIELGLHKDGCTFVSIFSSSADSMLYLIGFLFT